jgi:hypothetical protein
MLLIAFIALIFICLRKSHHQRLRIGVSIIALVAVVLVICDGCGGSGNVAPPLVGTAPGAYALVVTATGNGNVMATTTINLTVN